MCPKYTYGGNVVETLLILCTQYTFSGQVLSTLHGISVLSTLLVSFECEVMQKL